MRQWFYTEQGKQQGPIPEEQIAQMFRSGRLRTDTLVWTEGMAEWAAAHVSVGTTEPSPIASVSSQ